MSEKIIFEKVLNPTTRKIEAVEITIGDRKFFVAANQNDWPDVRIGPYPRSFDEKLGTMKDLPRMQLFEFTMLAEPEDEMAQLLNKGK